MLKIEPKWRNKESEFQIPWYPLNINLSPRTKGTCKTIVHTAEAIALANNCTKKLDIFILMWKIDSLGSFK